MDYRKKIPYDAFGDHAPIEGKSTEGDYIKSNRITSVPITRLNTTVK